MTLENKKAKGSQPSSRTPEQRRKNLEAVKRYYERKQLGVSWQPTEGAVTIGIVAPIAPGHENLSVLTESTIEAIAKRGAQTRALKDPIKHKKTLQAISTGYFQKEVPVLEDEPEVEDEKGI